MDESNITVIVVVAGLAIVGVIGSVIYYFARFYFRTDFDRDIEERKKTPALDESKDSLKEELAGVELQRSLDADFNKSLDQVPAEKRVEKAPAPSPMEPARPEQKSLQGALASTKSHLMGRIQALFRGRSLSDEEMEELEEILYTSDLGPQTVQRLLDSLSERLTSEERGDFIKVQKALRSEMVDIFSALSTKKSDIVGHSEGIQESKNEGSLSSVAESESILHELKWSKDMKSPTVWMIVGVNGVGKTTSIGKLAHLAAKMGKKVLVAAGDTFRAAAGEQLKAWSERAQVEIFYPEGVKDPSAVAFDACQRACAQGFDLVIIDTAGRLHNQSHLMEELGKMKRVIKKVIPEGPQETLLVLDANSGQNALVQAKTFNNLLELTGVILTKLDGTAKGGVALGLAYELELPIRLLGVGEGINDLRVFNGPEFVESII